VSQNLIFEKPILLIRRKVVVLLFLSFHINRIDKPNVDELGGMGVPKKERGEGMIRWAQANDTKRVISFLDGAGLGTDGVEESIEFFLILENESGKITGTLGIEPIGDIGMLRSFVMTEGGDEHQLLQLFEQMLFLARNKQLQSLYLATNKEASLQFFSMMGFVIEEKDQLPGELLSSKHVKHIFSVDNSEFMRLKV
jgi:N-acetylglutamate synthase-like GNAT family acetyltransferase